MKALTYTEIRGRPCRIMWSQRNPETRRNGMANLFVSKLPDDVSARQLWEAFSSFGNVLSVKLPTKDGKSLGFAYVSYDSEDAAKKAKESTHGMEWSGQELVVDHYVRRDERLKLLGHALVGRARAGRHHGGRTILLALAKRASPAKRGRVRRRRVRVRKKGGAAAGCVRSGTSSAAHAEWVAEPQISRQNERAARGCGGGRARAWCA